MANKRTLEQEYKILDDIQHCLARPGRYIGSVKTQREEHFVCENVNEPMILKEIDYNAGFLKLFDEIITNSVDESKRNGSKLDTIKVDISPEGAITIKDNGGIPVKIHKEYGDYLPKMIFGELKAGQNFNDKEDKRTGGGTHGEGATLVNIFSKFFKLSTCDGKKRYAITWTNNMRNVEKPNITNNSRNGTEIQWLTDWSVFGLKGLTDDLEHLLCRRVVDLAGLNPKLKFYWKGTLIKINSWNDYVRLYQDNVETIQSGGWNLSIGTSDVGFKHLSFVNGVHTKDGGTHLDWVLDEVVSEIRDVIKKKYKYDAKPSEIKRQMSVFLDATLPNPEFSSQSKEKLITPPSEFESTFKLSNIFIKKIMSSEVISQLLDWIDKKKLAEENRKMRELNKATTKVKISKLTDAKSKARSKCSLSIFEGDCLEENTELVVLGDDGISNKKIKDVKVNDLVITHNNRFGNVKSVAKKIAKKVEIKTKYGTIISSANHRFFVYDTISKKFIFKKVKDINIDSDKLIKNYLHMLESLIKINDIVDINEGKFTKLLICDDYEVKTNEEHKFCVFNNDTLSFDMKTIKEIDINTEYLFEGENRKK